MEIVSSVVLKILQLIALFMSVLITPRILQGIFHPGVDVDISILFLWAFSITAFSTLTWLI